MPPYCPATEEERSAVQAFEDEVIDRLFVLNASRAAEERRVAAPPAGAKQNGASKGRGGGKKKGAGAGAESVQLGLPGDGGRKG